MDAGRRVLVLCAGLAAAAVPLGTLVLAHAGEGSRPAAAQVEDAPPASLVARPIARSVQPQVAERLGVLRRPRAASDSLSRSGRTVVNDEDVPNTSGSNADLARDSAAVSGARRVFVVPGDDSVCLVLDARTPLGEEIAGGGCADLKEALSGRFVRTGYGPGFAGDKSVLVYGLVPDGVSSVTIYDTDDKARNVPVKGNVYAATFPDRGPLRVEVEGESVIAP